MKKFLTVLLAGCFAVSMTACGEKKAETTEKTVASTVEESAEESAEKTEATSAETTEATSAETTEATFETSADAEFDSALTGANSDSDIVDILTPKGAEIEAIARGSIVLNSTDSYEDLVSFYEEAIDSLGAVGEAHDSDDGLAILEDIADLGDADLAGLENVSTWSWDGTYSGDKPLTIVITDIGSLTQIAIQY